MKSANTCLGNGIADYVLVGGVTSQLFLAAKGVDLGKGNMALSGKERINRLDSRHKSAYEAVRRQSRVPVDVALDVNGKRKEIPVSKLPTEYSIFDIGTKTVENYAKLISGAKSIVVSGPMGVYENKEFNYGTKKVFEAIANSKAFSLAGGGNTIAAIQEYGLTKKISYISTAGGALIEFLMGKKLPGVVALETATKTKKI